MGSSPKELRKKWGKPDAVFRQNGVFQREVWRYKLLLGKHKVHYYLHFLDGILFHVQLRFRYLHKDQQEQVMNMLLSKYAWNVTKAYKEPHKVVLEDMLFNKIVVENGIELNVYYTSGNDTIAEMVFEEWEMYDDLRKRHEAESDWALLKAL